MRRKDREIEDINKIIEILKDCATMSIALCHDNKPYCVTLNYGVVVEDGKIELAFHSAPQGKKLDIIEINPQVSFAITNMYKAKEAQLACKWSAYYQSIAGYGICEKVEGNNKIKYFDAIMSNAGAQGKMEYDAAVLQSTVLYKIVVKEITGKANLPM